MKSNTMLENLRKTAFYLYETGFYTFEDYMKFCYSNNLQPF